MIFVHYVCHVNITLPVPRSFQGPQSGRKNKSRISSFSVNSMPSLSAAKIPSLRLDSTLFSGPLTLVVLVSLALPSIEVGSSRLVKSVPTSILYFLFFRSSSSPDAGMERSATCSRLHVNDKKKLKQVERVRAK
jgi:hypothetical protein